MTPAYNYFVQYPDAGRFLPIPSEIAIAGRLPIVVLPIAWAILSLFFYKITRDKPPEHRNEHLLAHTAATLCVGFSMLLFFLFSGILPFLRIGEMIR